MPFTRFLLKKKLVKSLKSLISTVSSDSFFLLFQGPFLKNFFTFGITESFLKPILKMAADQGEFVQLLNTLLSSDNDIRTQAEVRDLIVCLFAIN